MGTTAGGPRGAAPAPAPAGVPPEGVPAPDRPVGLVPEWASPPLSPLAPDSSCRPARMSVPWMGHTCAGTTARPGSVAGPPPLDCPAAHRLRPGGRRAGAGCCPCSRPHHSQPDPEPWASRCLPQLRCWRLCKEERSGPQPRPWGRAGPEGPGRGRWPRPRPVLSPRPGPEPALPTASPTILGSGSAGLGLGGESKVPEFRSGGRGRRGRGCSWERPAADRRKARGRAGGAG